MERGMWNRVEGTARCPHWQSTNLKSRSTGSRKMQGKDAMPLRLKCEECKKTFNMSEALQKTPTCAEECAGWASRDKAFRGGVPSRPSSGKPPNAGISKPAAKRKKRNPAPMLGTSMPTLDRFNFVLTLGGALKGFEGPLGVETQPTGPLEPLAGGDGWGEGQTAGHCPTTDPKPLPPVLQTPEARSVDGGVGGSSRAPPTVADLKEEVARLQGELADTRLQLVRSEIECRALELRVARMEKRRDDRVPASDGFLPYDADDFMGDGMEMERDGGRDEPTARATTSNAPPTLLGHMGVRMGWDGMMEKGDASATPLTNGDLRTPAATDATIGHGRNEPSRGKSDGGQKLQAESGALARGGELGHPLAEAPGDPTGAGDAALNTRAQPNIRGEGSEVAGAAPEASGAWQVTGRRKGRWVGGRQVPGDNPVRSPASGGATRQGKGTGGLTSSGATTGAPTTSAGGGHRPHPPLEPVLQTHSGSAQKRTEESNKGGTASGHGAQGGQSSSTGGGYAGAAKKGVGKSSPTPAKPKGPIKPKQKEGLATRAAFSAATFTKCPPPRHFKRLFFKPKNALPLTSARFNEHRAHLRMLVASMGIAKEVSGATLIPGGVVMVVVLSVDKDEVRTAVTTKGFTLASECDVDPFACPAHSRNSEAKDTEITAGRLADICWFSWSRTGVPRDGDERGIGVYPCSHPCGVLEAPAEPTCTAGTRRAALPLGGI
ncbi:hypothetical protein HDU93_000539 [Gonapodya sp. JEL0774]|nr:hypothetical protein HDU93_000539 [Gonapodya sp. JEL0774]